MKYSIYILFFIIFSIWGKAQFQMPDTSLMRGDIITLPIQWEGIPDEIENIDFKINFDLNMLEIKNVDVIQPSSVESKIVYSTDSPSFIEFKGDLENNSFSAEVTIEALAGPDSVTFLRIDTLNGDTYKFDNIISTLSIPDPIVISERNNIGEPFPNPFSNQFRVNISIKNKTRVFAKMFNAGAKLVAIEEEIQGVSIGMYNESMQKLEFGEIDEGEYQIIVDIDPNYFANGYYYLGIDLGGNTIYKPVIMAN